MRALNTACLALVAFVPFVSNVLSEYSHNYESNEQIATQLATAVLISAGLLQTFLWLFAVHYQRGVFLTTEARANSRLRRIVLLKSLALPSAMACVLLLSFVSPRTGSIAMDIFMVLAIACMVTLSIQAQRKPKQRQSVALHPTMDTDSDDEPMLSPVDTDIAFEL